MKNNLTEIVPHAHIEFDYVNWKGKKQRRRVEVGEFYYGYTEYHPEPQMLLQAFDLDKSVIRLFAVSDMTNVEKID